MGFVHNKIYDVQTDEEGKNYIVDWAGDKYYGFADNENFEVVTAERYDELMKMKEYQPHKCIVCGKSDFPMDESHEICPVCGWWDSSDTKWTHGVTADEYRELYNKGKASRGWEYLWERDKNIGTHLCPICGKTRFSVWDSQEICGKCGWIDDWKQNKDEDAEGPNLMSRREYRKAYKEGKLRRG